MYKQYNNINYYTSCKSGSNRILVNQDCICRPGTYDPENEDQICLPCNHSCLTCSGPTYQEYLSISNRISIENSCLCLDGYADYAIKQSTCGLCHPRCETCFQAADQTTNQYCITCIPGENRIVSLNFNCDCKPNYSVYEEDSEICLSCYYIVTLKIIKKLIRQVECSKNLKLINYLIMIKNK